MSTPQQPVWHFVQIIWRLNLGTHRILRLKVFHASTNLTSTLSRTAAFMAGIERKNKLKLLTCQLKQPLFAAEIGIPSIYILKSNVSVELLYYFQLTSRDPNTIQLMNFRPISLMDKLCGKMVLKWLAYPNIRKFTLKSTN